jgi:hypothetical protein
MKTKPSSKILPFVPGEDDIREYAYHLYVQSGCVPGRDLENWLEARACLMASIPRQHSHGRLHRHMSKAAATVPNPDSKNLVA